MGFIIINGILNGCFYDAPYILMVNTMKSYLVDLKPGRTVSGPEHTAIV